MMADVHGTEYSFLWQPTESHLDTGAPDVSDELGHLNVFSPIVVC